MIQGCSAGLRGIVGEGCSLDPDVTDVKASGEGREAQFTETEPHFLYEPWIGASDKFPEQRPVGVRVASSVRSSA